MPQPILKVFFHLQLLPLLGFEGKTAILIGTAEDHPLTLLPFLYHIGRPTAGTLSGDRLVPQGKITVRVVATAVKHPPFPGTAFHQPTLTPFHRAVDPGLFIPNIATLRVVAAGYELPVSPLPQKEGFIALGTPLLKLDLGW